MARTYGRIETTIWQNPKFRALTEEAQLFYLYLLTCPHGNAIGCFLLPVGYVTADLEWDAETFREAVSECVSEGLIERDEATGLTRIKGWWGHNTFENANVAKAAAKASLALPHRSAVYHAFYSDAEASKERFTDKIWEPFWGAVAKPSEPRRESVATASLPKEPIPNLTKPEPNQTKPDGATAPPSASPEPDVQMVQNVSREISEPPADPLKADDELVDDAPPASVAKRGTRLPVDWMPGADDIAFCRTHRPDLAPGAVADEFRDYWIAKAGSGGVKLDWHATWRTWVRRQQAPKTPAFRTRDDDRAETIRQLRSGEI